MGSKNELSGVKTEILVAFIFEILALIGWIVGMIILGILALLYGIVSGLNQYVFAALIVPAIIYTIIFLILFIPTILVLIRTNRMRKALNKGDIQTLKSLNSIGWAIVALIFSGIIPGIMLLIAYGPIEEYSAEGELSENTIDKLVKLKTLMDSGVITKEEFELQKAKLYGTSSSGSVEEQLAKLKSLLDSGAITQSEYEEQREALIKKLI